MTYPAYSNKRVHPLTGAISGRSVSEEYTIGELTDDLPGVYGVQLLGSIVQGSLLVYENNTAAAEFEEVTTLPLAGQVAVRYSSGLNKRGLLIFNAADDGKDIVAEYDDAGTVNTRQALEAIALAAGTAGGEAIIDSAESRLFGRAVGAGTGAAGPLTAAQVHAVLGIVSGTYTPTISGFGTVSNVEFRYIYNATLGRFDLWYRFQCGTVASSEAQIGLPTIGTQLLVDDLISTSIHHVGTQKRNQAASASLYDLLATPGDAFLNVSSVSAGLTPQNGDALADSSQVLSGKASLFVVPT